MTWLLLVVRLTGESSRTRVAVWRELRKMGAAPVSSGIWTVPHTPYFSAAVKKVVEIAGRSSGDVLVLLTSGGSDPGGEALCTAFKTQRLDEWQEFSRGCSRFEEETAEEIRNGKFTLAKLGEKEQSLERLRRGYRDLRSRDVLELPEAQAAETLLRRAARAVDDYAEKVYSVLHEPAGTILTGSRI